MTRVLCKNGSSTEKKAYFTQSFSFQDCCWAAVKLVGNLEEKLFTVQSSALKKTLLHCNSLGHESGIYNVIEN